jgi:lipopolysaccharide transport system ATP-binding protein
MARFTEIRVSVDGGDNDKNLVVKSQKSDVDVAFMFASDPALPSPSVAVVFLDENGKAVASSSTQNDGISIPRKPDGSGGVSLTFHKVPLLKGKYILQAFLLCERGIHLYESASPVAELTVVQDGLEQGIIALPHRWVQLGS